jgi:hypothetical protein
MRKHGHPEKKAVLPRTRGGPNSARSTGTRGHVDECLKFKKKDKINNKRKNKQKKEKK